jgi:hypothetical protein
MNVIVDVRGMNVNMRVSEDPIEGIFCLAPKAQDSPRAWGSAPGFMAQKRASAESAIHFRPILFHRSPHAPIAKQSHPSHHL